MIRPQTASSRLRHAFTLIELLVAAAITALLAGTIVSLLANALTHWNRTQGALAANAEARTVLDGLEQDLQGAIWRDGGRAWLAATIQADTSVSGSWTSGGKPAAESLLLPTGNLAQARFGMAGTWLRFFTAARGSDAQLNAPSAPVAVSYQIIRRTPTASSPTCGYLLYRGEVAPADTFAAGYDLHDPAYTSTADSVGGSASIVSPALSQLLANNVIDFGVRFYGAAPDAATGGWRLQPIFPIDASHLDFGAHAGAGSVADGRIPVMAEVFLRILTPEGARLIAALESGQVGGDWWSVAEANSATFTRRIQLRSEPP